MPNRQFRSRKIKGGADSLVNYLENQQKKLK